MAEANANFVTMLSEIFRSDFRSGLSKILKDEFKSAGYPEATPSFNFNPEPPTDISDITEMWNTFLEDEKQYEDPHPATISHY